MSDTTSQSTSTPAGWHTVTPRIVAHDAKALVGFLAQVFGATGEYLQTAPSVIRIGDSQILISDAGERNPMTAFLHVYVADADATHRRAVEAGARTLEEPFDTPYGDRRSMVMDRWGNTRQIASHKGPGATPKRER